MKGTFVHNPDTNVNAKDINQNTPLAPFWKTQSAFANSLDAQSTSAYGYTYPEIAAAGPVSPNQLSEIILQTVDQLYGGGSFFSAFRVTTAKAKDVAVEALRQGVEKAKISPVVKGNAIHIPKRAAFTAVPLAKKVQVPLPIPPPANNPHPPPASNNPPTSSGQPQVAVEPITPSLPEAHLTGDDYVVTPDTYRDWIANVTLEKYALKGSGRVCFFLGPTNEIPENPSDWFASPIYVGMYTIFATNPVTTGCKNCKDQADKRHRVGGTVHLTKALIRHHIPLTGNEPVNYLKENLHWRLCDVNENEVLREDVPSLKVVVQSAGYTVPPGGIGRRPLRGPWVRHAPVTRGRPGGVDHEDEFNS
jgi:tyrosinase